MCANSSWPFCFLPAEDVLLTVVEDPMPGPAGPPLARLGTIGDANTPLRRFQTSASLESTVEVTTPLDEPPADEPTPRHGQLARVSPRRSTAEALLIGPPPDRATATRTTAALFKLQTGAQIAAVPVQPLDTAEKLLALQCAFKCADLVSERLLPAARSCV